VLAHPPGPKPNPLREQEAEPLTTPAHKTFPGS